MKLAIAAVVLGVLLSANPALAAVSDGWLVRAVNEAKVYYIDQGVRRYISSPEILHTQGLEQEPIHTIALSELLSLPEGERLMVESTIVLPQDETVAPDLVPLTPSDLKLDTVNGRKVLRFTAKFSNVGGGALDLQPSAGETVQHILRADGTERRKVVGAFVWHAEHYHYHFSDFADYIIESAQRSSETLVQEVVQKTTFCMRDNERLAFGTRQASAPATFTTCNQYRQGVSQGWIDVYPSTLPDQFIDVNDLVPGVYRLSFDVDPRGYFVEQDRTNNRSSALVYLDVGQNIMNILAAGSSATGGQSTYQDGLLVRGDEQPGVFVMHHNRKFPLRTEDMFLSRGFSWDNVYWLPQSVVDVIPDAPFKATDAAQVYALNAEGFRRRVLNPEVYNSYGWKPGDEYAVSAEELASYPETDLVAPEGADKVYTLST